jgi:hypothetical protein
VSPKSEFSRPPDTNYWRAPWSSVLFAGDVFEAIPFPTPPTELVVHSEYEADQHFVGEVGFAGMTANGPSRANRPHVMGPQCVGRLLAGSGPAEKAPSSRTESLARVPKGWSPLAARRTSSRVPRSPDRQKPRRRPSKGQAPQAELCSPSLLVSCARKRVGGLRAFRPGFWQRGQ